MIRNLIVMSLLLGSNFALAAGDAAAGKAVSMRCIACHGPAGKSMNPIWPNLAGQQGAYLLKQLKDFKSGKRKDPVMTGQAKLLNDKQMQDVSAYFSGLK